MKRLSSAATALLATVTSPHDRAGGSVHGTCDSAAGAVDRHREDLGDGDGILHRVPRPARQ